MLIIPETAPNTNTYSAPYVSREKVRNIILDQHFFTKVCSLNRNSESLGLLWAQGLCISNRLPGGVDVQFLVCGQQFEKKAVFLC